MKADAGRRWPMPWKMGLGFGLGLLLGCLLRTGIGGIYLARYGPNPLHD